MVVDFSVKSENSIFFIPSYTDFIASQVSRRRRENSVFISEKQWIFAPRVAALFACVCVGTEMSAGAVCEPREMRDYLCLRAAVATPRLCARKREQDDGRGVVSLLQIRAANNTPVAKLLAAVYLGRAAEREWKKQPKSRLRKSQREIYCLFCLD